MKAIDTSVAVEEAEAPVETSPRPFALRFAERAVAPTRQRQGEGGGPEVFDDPTTVEHTAPDSEDAHTDES